MWGAVGGLVCAAAGRLEPNLLEEGLLLHVGERMLGGGDKGASGCLVRS